MMGCCISREILTAAYVNPASAGDVSQSRSTGAGQDKREQPETAEAQDICKQDRTDFCWDPILQNCFGSTNGFFSGSKQTLNGYDINALARSSLVGLVQTAKDHITKPTAMARGRVAHIIEWKGWGTQRRSCDAPRMDEDQYSTLTDELKEARFAAGVAEQFAITEATLSAWSSLDTDGVLGDSSPSIAVNYLNTEDSYYDDRSLSGSQGFYSLNVEGPCVAASPQSSSMGSPAGEEVPVDKDPAHPLTGTLGLEPPKCLYVPEAGGGGLDIHRTLQQSTGSHLQHSHSSNTSSLIEDDVFYN
ncbi:protein FAM131C isoform X1 [Amblyraja radiata]|uniref:protein FAM131C isoform X1 n=1 Tax=Amblyraja radiata TaxID=386614 RepID=UPI0014034799|nr:protein FAM131C isoform X1 [Amblyraja radiata]